MPPLTPTIILTPNPATGVIDIAINNQGAVVDHNEVWRRNVNEYGGAFVQIGVAPQDEIFSDVQAAGNAICDFYVVAVDALNAKTTSATASTSLSLDNAVLSAVAMRSGNFSNAQAVGSGSFWAAFLEISETQQYDRAEATFNIAGADAPQLTIGTIDKDKIALTARVPQASLSLLPVLRDMKTSRYFLCLRNSLGNKWFGYLSEYGESYNHGYVDVGMTFAVCAYSEA